MMVVSFLAGMWSMAIVITAAWLALAVWSEKQRVNAECGRQSEVQISGERALSLAEQYDLIVESVMPGVPNFANTMRRWFEHISTHQNAPNASDVEAVDALARLTRMRYERELLVTKLQEVA
jgi:hypothetical protein